jgi:GntR family transcriptional regulator/MocR family aminotransferase
MALARTTLDRDVFLEVRPGRGCRAALERALRQAIRSGRLRAGTPLPSTRVLADDIGVARSTVSEAYAQLTAAGYLITRQGADTRVASGLQGADRDHVDCAPAPAPHFDLRPGVPDLSSFPKTLWQRAFRQALARASLEAFGPGDPQGRPELRTALVEYLGRTRGVTTKTGRVLVCNGFTQGLRLVADALRARGASRIGVEDPSLPRFSAIAQAAGLQPVPIAVDEEGLTTNRLDEIDLDAILVTPAHQFPLGSTMGSQRRTELLSWANRHGAFVIEDDCDGEFRYGQPPIGALQGLDPDHVVYGGTAGKTLAPGVRLGWLALPPSLLASALESRSVADRYSGVLDQLALAELIESGDFDRHVRAMRREYRGRRDLIVAAVARSAPELSVRGTEAGLHAVLELPTGLTERELLSAAERRSIGLHGLGWYRRGVYSGPQALVVGFGSPAPYEFEACVQALAAMLHQTRHKSSTYPARG